MIKIYYNLIITHLNAHNKSAAQIRDHLPDPCQPKANPRSSFADQVSDKERKRTSEATGAPIP